MGIRVIALAPGYFDTVSTRSNVPAARLKEITQGVPLKRLGKMARSSLPLNSFLRIHTLTGQCLIWTEVYALSVYSHNVYDVFRKLVASYGARPALVWSDSEVATFAELDELSCKAAAYLQRHGVRKGDRVCLRLDKCALAYSLIIASLRIGAPYFFVDPVIRRREFSTSRQV